MMKQGQAEKDARSVEESEKAFHDAKVNAGPKLYGVGKLIYPRGFSHHVYDTFYRLLGSLSVCAPLK